MSFAYTGTEENVTAAVNQININCGLPFGSTQTWDEPKQAYLQSFWFIWMPNVDGWIREDGTHFTQDQMIENVINVNIEDSQSDWFPPISSP